MTPASGPSHTRSSMPPHSTRHRSAGALAGKAGPWPAMSVSTRAPKRTPSRRSMARWGKRLHRSRKQPCGAVPVTPVCDRSSSTSARPAASAGSAASSTQRQRAWQSAQNQVSREHRNRQRVVFVMAHGRTRVREVRPGSPGSQARSLPLTGAPAVAGMLVKRCAMQACLSEHCGMVAYVASPYTLLPQWADSRAIQISCTSLRISARQAGPLATATC